MHRMGRWSTFRALEHRDFRLMWTGLTASAVGTWMQIVAQSLLVLELTHGSAIALGTVSLAQALSFFLFAPVGGSTADRFDKRRVLLLTQSLMMGMAVLMGLLTATGVIRFWMIPGVAFVSGAVLSFDQPTRNALLGTLVPKEHLMNAVSLQSAMFNGASTLGPALAGLTLGKVGYAGNFFLNAASYLAVLAALFLLRTRAPVGEGRGRGGLLSSVREALRHVQQDGVLPSALWAYGVLLFFGPSMPLMLPLFAVQVMHRSAAQLGILFSAVGAGTVLGALAVASLGDVRYKGRFLFGSAWLWVAALALLTSSAALYVSIPALLAMGAAQTIAGTVVVTLLQTRVPPEMRGRAMSLNTLLIMCVRPLGDFPAGALIALLGFRPAVLISAAVVGMTSAALFVLHPAVRRA
jgi:MFS family permease